MLPLLPGLWEDLRWLFLEGFRHSPLLAALLACRGAERWVHDSRSRRLAKELGDLLARVKNVGRLLDDPKESSALVALAGRLRSEIGPDRLALSDLRDYLCEGLRWELRRAGWAADATDLEAELARRTPSAEA